MTESTFRTTLLTALLVASATGTVAAEVARPSITEEDARIEHILLKGKVERTEKIPVGVTLPQRAWLTYEGETVSAAFKTVDVAEHGISRFKDRSTEVNFSDRYQYERAAYLVARELGLHTVPVAVDRKIRGREGSLVHWVDDTFSESERAQQRLVPPDVDRWQRQLGVMRVFDALICNVDRNPGNILYTRDDWNVYLIDHTRAFRLEESLIEEFTSRPARLDRHLLKKLEQLDEERLRQVLKRQVTGRQVARMMARRDLILAKIAADRETLGDDAVLFGE